MYLEDLKSPSVQSLSQIKNIANNKKKIYQNHIPKFSGTGLFRSTSLIYFKYFEGANSGIYRNIFLITLCTS